MNSTDFASKMHNIKQVKLDLKDQFFTRNCNPIFRNYWVATARKKLQPVLAKFADTKIVRASQFFCNFSEVVALPRQDMLHKEN